MAVDRRDTFAPPPIDRRRWLWTASQRRALAAIVLAGATAVSALLLARPSTISDPQPIAPPLAGDLADRIDPNLAPADRLAVLPGLGPVKAQAIVRYRDTSNRQPAFRSASDLTRVHGIGTVTANNLAPYLTFPSSEQ